MKTLLQLLFLIGITAIKAQDLYVGSSSSITIQSNATLNINGLGLAPNTDYTLPSNTTLERSSIPANTGNLAISRQFILTPSLDNYKGTLVFQYEDSELNFALETELQLELYNNINANWTPYPAIIDDNANQMTYNFVIPASFSGVTADYIETSIIDTPNLNLNIKVFPNPTKDKIYIEYIYPVRTTLYNILGQLIAKGSAKELDLAAYKQAIYFLYIEDDLNQRTYMFKVAKL
jgi:hypothetical protein